ncbi:hypothetical protein FACS1894162_0520 [Bacteroidia bacterium]|nr:hypothetical protein FACS1894162_0520 [Bacteroidia bacterium]
MKQFIYKSALFLLPFVVLWGITQIGYSTGEGDLSRLGYLTKDTPYWKQFIRNTPVYYDKISELDTTKTMKYSVLTFGDSFSHFFANSNYVNYLAESDSVSVLNFTTPSSPSVFSDLSGFINGDVFDKVSVDYVIVESGERYVISRIQTIDKNWSIHLKDIVHPTEKKIIPSQHIKSILLYPFYLLMRSIAGEGRSLGSQCYQFTLTAPLFSGKRASDLFVYHEDIMLAHQNTQEAVETFNEELNVFAALLAKKGIKLIVLPAANKYSVYYEFIQSKEKYLKPQFFELLKPLDKSYIYIDSHEILAKAAAQGIKDLYFADDTHWSPIGAKLIAEKLANDIKAQKLYKSGDCGSNLH